MSVISFIIGNEGNLPLQVCNDDESPVMLFENYSSPVLKEPGTYYVRCEHNGEEFRLFDVVFEGGQLTIKPGDKPDTCRAIARIEAIYG